MWLKFCFGAFGALFERMPYFVGSGLERNEGNFDDSAGRSCATSAHLGQWKVLGWRDGGVA